LRKFLPINETAVVVENAENGVQLDLNGLYINCIMKLLIGKKIIFPKENQMRDGGGMKDANI
jgi:hypothetical protein